MLTSLGTTLYEAPISQSLPQFRHQSKNSLRFGHIGSSRDVITPPFSKIFCPSNNCLLETPSYQNAFPGKLPPGLLAESSFSVWWLPLNVLIEHPFGEHSLRVNMNASTASMLYAHLLGTVSTFLMYTRIDCTSWKLIKISKLQHYSESKENIGSLRLFPSTVK